MQLIRAGEGKGAGAPAWGSWRLHVATAVCRGEEGTDCCVLLLLLKFFTARALLLALEGALCTAAACY